MRDFQQSKMRRKDELDEEEEKTLKSRTTPELQHGLVG